MTDEDAMTELQRLGQEYDAAPMTDELEGAPETIWIRWSDISNHIRKWSRDPFKQGASYTRTDVLEQIIVEARNKAFDEAATHFEGQWSESGCSIWEEIKSLKSPTT